MIDKRNKIIEKISLQLCPLKANSRHFVETEKEKEKCIYNPLSNELQIGFKTDG